VGWSSRQLLVLVNAAADFAQHHLVANEATDLLVKVVQRGRASCQFGAGMASLPFNFEDRNATNLRGAPEQWRIFVPTVSATGLSLFVRME
jgi:hypothetical protein